MSRRTLTNEEDVNNLTQSGIYYVADNDYPLNIPVDHNGRLVVFKAVNTQSYAVAVQFFFTQHKAYMRISNNQNDVTQAWTDVEWVELADSSIIDDVFMSRGTLDVTADLNSITKPGLYYISSTNGFPANSPAPVDGRVMVFKSNSTSNAIVAQLYFSNTNNYGEKAFIRVSTNTAGSTAWDNAKWYSITFDSTIVNVVSTTGVKTTIPLTYGNILGVGRFAYAANRIRPNMSFANLVNFYLPGHKIRFYYYSEPYNLTIDNQGVIPDSFLRRGEWVSLDSKVSPEQGMWFSFMIAKNDETDFTNAELNYAKENLYVEALKDDNVYHQMETIPYNATTYHAKWDSIVDGNYVTRTLLGKVNNDDSLPIYAYEIKLQKNWVDVNYQLHTYDGSNALYPRKKALIIAGQHGNEKCTPMDALNFAKNILNGKLKDLGAM